MKIRTMLNSGSVIEIPCVRYHPDFARRTGPTGETALEPGSLWVSMQHIRASIMELNAAREKHNLPGYDISTTDKLCDLLKYAEAPFEVYDQSNTNDPEPWKHNGTYITKVPYGADTDFWNKHA